ncbi:TniB family NTP-binding protein [Phenylobacterium soli]|uniref:AAA+ ATPase domain-containing protein n=2 Tax=Phenylobacterium soli TaxID=2170551 RepID=A0A328AEY9_9CAUL|nr:TniB family NTP-binding protein [Phenylobacterium soli]RAK51964.1 hypothetical protein DJ017_18220 [Phenylobacterium soli]
MTSDLPEGLDPARPATGQRIERVSGEINAEVAAKVATFHSLYLPYPPHTELHGRIDYVLKLGQLTRGQPQKGLRVLAPSGSGKTATAKAVIRRIESLTPRTETFIPALYVPLERDTTPKKLMIEILQAFGDPFALRGTEITLKDRAYACFERFGTQVLFIDEVQHLRPGVKRTTSDATDALKRMLDSGVVPIVFLGTEEAEDLFTRNVQLSSRLHPPADLRRLQRDDERDRGLLMGFVKKLDAKLVEEGLTSRSSPLSHPWVRACLHEVSDGVIGRISRLLAVAFEISLRRDAEMIEAHDLAEATDRWAVAQGFATTNPFRTNRPNI